MAKAYQYTADGYFAGESEDYGLLPSNATYTAPPAQPWGRKWPRFTGDVWELIEDHRERNAPYFPEDVEQDATEYWLPAPYGDDAHESQPRMMKEPGPLPEGAVLTRPEKTHEDLATGLRSQRDSRIYATQWLAERHTDELANAGATTLSADQYAELLAYRQALRDMPQAEGFPWDGGGDATPWPVKPV